MAKIAGGILCDDHQIADTKQCVHCGRHWQWEHGSGKVRGYCMNCGGITCGNKRCHKCIPWEKKLELYEKGKLKTLC